MKLLASVTAIGLVGCLQSQPELASTAGMSFDEFRAAAAQSREPGTGAYILDGDIPIHGDDALYRYWQRAQQGALTIYSIAGVDIKWSATDKLNLTYCVSNGFGARKQDIINAMKAATDNGWAKFADVKFIYKPTEDANCTAQNANVVFDINQVDSNGQFLARAFFPDYPRDQRNVLVDPDSFNTIWPLSNILAHELGHALGFRHEHIRAPGNPCPEDQDFRSITAYDSASVMHYPQCNGTSQNLAFTALDKTGVALVYGEPIPNLPPMVAINSPVNGATVPPTFNVESSLLDMDLAKGELLIDGTVYATQQAGPFVFAVTELAEGPHTLVVRGTDSLTQVTEVTIMVTVVKPQEPGDGDGDGSGDGDGDGSGGGDDGGCSTGGSSSVGLLVALGLVGLVRRRRR